MLSESDHSRLATEAHARIIWGEPVEQVREWLCAENMPSQDIDEIMAASVRERAAEFRKRGILEILVALPIVLLPAAAILGMHFAGFVVVKLFAILGLAAAYGVYRVIVGLFWLLGGSKNPGSLGPSG